MPPPRPPLLDELLELELDDDELLELELDDELLELDEEELLEPGDTVTLKLWEA